MTLEDLEVIKKNYKKVYEEELEKVYSLYPEAKARYEEKMQIVIRKEHTKSRFYFLKKKVDDNIIKLNAAKK